MNIITKIAMASLVILAMTACKQEVKKPEEAAAAVAPAAPIRPTKSAADEERDRIEANRQVMQFGKPEKIDPAKYKNRF